jgi:hypothetical protein
MALDAAWLKKHWYYIAGGLVGILVLYELVQSLNGTSSASSSSGGDLSGGANQLQTYTAQADLVDAQTNAQVETASYSADVANNQTAAALQLGEVQTAAELSATNNTTAANESETNLQTTTAGSVALGEAADAVNVANTQTLANQAVDLGLGSDAVEAQKIVTQGQVQETQIEGSALENLATTAASIPLAQIAGVNQQISNIQAYSPNANKAFKAIAPIIAEEEGQGSSAAPLAAAETGNQSSVAQNISATGGAVSGITNSVGGLLKNLFGGL